MLSFLVPNMISSRIDICYALCVLWARSPYQCKYWCWSTLERTSCFLDRMEGAPQFNPRVRDGPSREGAYSMALRLNVCGYDTYLCGEIAIWEELSVSTLVAYNDVKCTIGIPTLYRIRCRTEHMCWETSHASIDVSGCAIQSKGWDTTNINEYNQGKMACRVAD